MDYLGKRWEEVQAELVKTKRKHDFYIVSPGNTAVLTGDLRVVRVIATEEKLLFALLHERYIM